MSNLSPRTYSLASCYENAITTILRLSSLQQRAVPSSQAFRTSIRAALKAAMEQAKSLGYSSEINQLAFFAVVALLDESVLRLQNLAFADWAQRPLQEELFGHNRAGEVFFEHLRTLLAQQDSQETADCLEVYCLAMQLGFKGRYALSSSDTDYFLSQVKGAATSAPRLSGEIQALVRQAREKIERIRGQALFLRAASPPPEVKRAANIDRWSRGLGIAAVSLFALTILAFIIFLLVLNSGVTRVA
jgi:type VI secretion system protein ImpK